MARGLELGVCLEAGPEATGAFVPDCPGCWVFARDPRRALNKAKAAVSEWHAWMEGHGESCKAPRRMRVEPAEVLTVNYNPIEAGKPEPLFWSEVLPVTTGDVERTLRLMEYSRSDLLRLCSRLDERALRWKPEKDSGASGTV